MKTWVFIRGDNNNPYPFFKEEPYLMFVMKKLK
jgi:hypothetical protein